jgi:imidazolonepropionase
LVFAGDRAPEFELRLQGASYEEIARAGGGIASTVRATRAATEDELFEASMPRARALLADGVTTLEIKSGYGLDTANEIKMLRVARRIGVALGIGVRTSFLGAHALPPEFAGRADDYIDTVCNQMLPAVAEAGLADAVDAFCESIGFSLAQTQRVFDAARALGLPLKLHAEQLSLQGGAKLAASYGALSADHLEHIDEDGVRAMARAATVAVLLPGAFVCLRETRLPPIDSLRAHGVVMAVATDCNPGTSPLLSLRLAMGLACTQFRLSPEEALRGATVNAAKALGLSDRGTLAMGQRADFVIWNAREPAELSYWLGGDLASRVFVGGVIPSPCP